MKAGFGVICFQGSRCGSRDSAYFGRKWHYLSLCSRAVVRFCGTAGEIPFLFRFIVVRRIFPRIHKTLIPKHRPSGGSAAAASALALMICASRMNSNSSLAMGIYVSAIASRPFRCINYLLSLRVIYYCLLHSPADKKNALEASDEESKRFVDSVMFLCRLGAHRANRCARLNALKRV